MLQRSGFKNVAGYAREYAGKNILKIKQLEVQKADILSGSGILNKVTHYSNCRNAMAYSTYILEKPLRKNEYFFKGTV